MDRFSKGLNVLEYVALQIKIARHTIQMKALYKNAEVEIGKDMFGK